MQPIVAEFFGGPWDGMRKTYETDIEWIDLPIITGEFYVTELRHRYYRIAKDMWIYAGIWDDDFPFRVEYCECCKKTVCFWKVEFEGRRFLVCTGNRWEARSGCGNRMEWRVSIKGVTNDRR